MVSVLVLSADLKPPHFKVLGTWLSALEFKTSRRESQCRCHSKLLASRMPELFGNYETRPLSTLLTAPITRYGQLSGLVEPVAGVLGAALVTLIVPILPYALAFAAGAMIYVVVDDIIPESQAEGNGKLASWGAIIGFIVMMSLDVSLG